MAERTACVERNTLETQIKVSINLDGTGKARFAIGVPFLEHMLDQIARHGLIDLDIECQGDLHIDDHHTVEDVGITLGQAFTKAIGDKKGMTRYGHSYVPLDEAQAALSADPVKSAVAALDNAANGGMFGMGTDEKKIQGVLENIKDPAQRKQVMAEYQKKTGTSLDKMLKSEMSGNDLALSEALLEGNKAKAAAVKLGVQALPR